MSLDVVQPSPATPGSSVGGFREWWLGLLADRGFRGVVFLLVCVWLGWILCLRHSGSLPFCDEYAFVIAGITTGEKPVTWEFLWEPSNEHRYPLTRLWTVFLGRWCHWDFSHMQRVNVTLLTLGCLSLVLAVRQVRGRSHFADLFLPLVLLTPAQFDTLAIYAAAYAMPLAVWCMTAAVVMVKGQTRSVACLVGYLLGALVVAWGGGPAGNLWALGLCVPLARGWSGTGRTWKVCALVGGLAVVASSAYLLRSIPPSPAILQSFHSTSLGETRRAACRLAAGWLGAPPLCALYPNLVLVPALVCVACLFARFAQDLRRSRLAALLPWSDVSALFVVGLVVVGAMAHGRARYPNLWASRYCALEVPIAVAGYLLLVRAAVPKTLLTCLTLGLAGCVGWNMPETLRARDYLKPRQQLLCAELRRGREPLSVLADQYPDAAGWCREFGLAYLITWWHDLRQARVSAFYHSDSDRRCLFWHARSGTLEYPLAVVYDPAAVDYRGVAAQTPDGASTAVYEVDVPADGGYRLCGRWLAPQAGLGFGVAVDDRPTVRYPIVPAKEYKPALSSVLYLSAGRHRITVTWPGAGARVDVFELTPE